MERRCRDDQRVAWRECNGNGCGADAHRRASDRHSGATDCDTDSADADTGATDCDTDSADADTGAADCDADSAYADAVLHGDGLTSLQYREAKGARTYEIQSAVSAPARLRIEKRGK